MCAIMVIAVFLEGTNGFKGDRFVESFWLRRFTYSLPSLGHEKGFNAMQDTAIFSYLKMSSKKRKFGIIGICLAI